MIFLLVNRNTNDCYFTEDLDLIMVLIKKRHNKMYWLETTDPGEAERIADYIVENE